MGYKKKFHKRKPREKQMSGLSVPVYHNNVELALKKVDRSIQLVIKDNGIGCDMKKIEKKKDKGIGLMLIKERALSLGGDSKIECILNKGTRLLVVIPTKE